MSGFVKLFSSIIDSTIWREKDTVRIVWITMLAKADKDGLVEASVPGLADAARVTLSDCEDALERLSAPDKYSRTKDNDGRRIRETEGGWILLNHAKYRADTSADRTRAWRERNKTKHVTQCDVTERHVTQCDHPDTDTDTDTEKNKTYIYHGHKSNTSPQRQDDVKQDGQVDEYKQEVINCALESLPLEADREVARAILEEWPDSEPAHVVDLVVKAKSSYLRGFENPVQWVHEIAANWAPSTPIYENGRYRLHSWLISCLKTEAARRKDEAEKSQISAPVRPPVCIERTPEEKEEQLRLEAEEVIIRRMSRPHDEYGIDYIDFDSPEMYLGFRARLESMGRSDSQRIGISDEDSRDRDYLAEHPEIEERVTKQRADMVSVLISRGFGKELFE